VMDDCPELPALVLGAMRVGAIPVPVNPFAHTDDLRHFVTDSGAAVVAFDSPRAEAVLSAARALDSHRLLCVDAEVDRGTTLAAASGTAPARVPTLFSSGPRLYNVLLAAPAVGDFGSVRACVSAAEPLPAGIWQRWHERYGLVILNGIGSTEMLHIYCSNRL